MNKKKYKHLTLDQRYIIESGLKKGLLKKEIAELVGVSPSTITREIKRNANKSGRYTQMHAQMLANEDKERVKRNKKIGKGVWKKVIEKLREDWSPQQISGWLKRRRRLIYRTRQSTPISEKIRQKGANFTHTADTS